MNTVSAIFSAIAEFFGWRKQRDANQNTADMKAQAKGQIEADAEKKTNAAIANQDTDEIRRELSE